MAKVVGIDLGTTNSVIAFLESGKPEIIANAEGARTTPSVVAYKESGERLVGLMAKRQAILNPQNTIFSAKRFIGRKWNEVQAETKNVSYRVVNGPNDAVRLMFVVNRLPLKRSLRLCFVSSQRMPQNF